MKSLKEVAQFIGEFYGGEYSSIEITIASQNIVSDASIKYRAYSTSMGWSEQHSTIKNAIQELETRRQDGREYAKKNPAKVTGEDMIIDAQEKLEVKENK